MSGISYLVLGEVSFFSPGLLFPHEIASQAATRDRAMSRMASGISYSILAFQENRASFELSVACRMISAAFLWNLGAMPGQETWRAAAAWEGMGAALTAGTLLPRRLMTSMGDLTNRFLDHDLICISNVRRRNLTLLLVTPPTATRQYSIALLFFP